MSTDAVGNPWTVALDLGRAYEDRGVEVVLVSLGRKLSAEQRREAWAITTLTLHEQSLRSEWMDDPWSDVDQTGERLLALEQRYAPDVVHLHGYAHGALPFRAPVVVSAHGCVLAWWEASQHRPAPAAFEVYRKRAGAGLRGADAIVSATSSMLRELRRQHGAMAPARVIPTGCAVDRFSPNRKEDVVLSASRSWDGFRNLNLLVQAADQVRWPSLVATDDTRPPGEVPRVPAEHNGVQGLGRLSRGALAERLGRAAIYALPGSLDPTGLSVLEAALSGCALVLGDTDSLRELWEGIAVFVASEDVRGLATAINQLVDDPRRRATLGRAARERALSCSAAASADAHLALFEELKARPREGRWADKLRSVTQIGLCRNSSA